MSTSECKPFVKEARNLDNLKFSRYRREGRREEKLTLTVMVLKLETRSKVMFLLQGKRRKTWFIKQQEEQLYCHRGLLQIAMKQMSRQVIPAFPLSTNILCPFTSTHTSGCANPHPQTPTKNSGLLRRVIQLLKKHPGFKTKPAKTPQFLELLSLGLVLFFLFLFGIPYPKSPITCTTGLY